MNWFVRRERSAVEVHGTLFPRSPRAAFTGQMSWGAKVQQLSVNTEAGYQPPTSNWGCSGTLGPFPSSVNGE